MIGEYLDRPASVAFKAQTLPSRHNLEEKSEEDGVCAFAMASPETRAGEAGLSLLQSAGIPRDSRARIGGQQETIRDLGLVCGSWDSTAAGCESQRRTGSTSGGADWGGPSNAGGSLAPADAAASNPGGDDGWGVNVGGSLAPADRAGGSLAPAGDADAEMMAPPRPPVEDNRERFWWMENDGCFVNTNGDQAKRDLQGGPTIMKRVGQTEWTTCYNAVTELNLLARHPPGPPPE